MDNVGDVLGERYRDLLKHFATITTSTRKGKLLLSVWVFGSGASLVLGAIGKAYFRRERALQQKKKQDEAKTVEKRQGLVEQLSKILPIAFPSPLSKSSMYLTVYTALLIVRILLTIKIAKTTGKLGKMIGARSFSKMFHLQVIFGLWCMPAALVNSLLAYTQDQTALSMRNELTRYLHNKYFSNLVFYRASNVGKRTVDDVDQRTTQDLKKFCSSASELYGNLLKPICELVLLSWTLAKLMGVKHLMGFYVFFLISGQWLRFVMPPFAQIHADTQRLEGEFRTHHTRVITHSEEIAFYGGAEREKSILNKAYARIVALARRHHYLQMLMSVLDSYLVKYGASMVAYSMLIPAVYLGQHGLKGKNTSYVMEYYITSTQLFISLGTACKHLVLSYKRIQALSGLTTRMTELFQMIKKRASYEDEKEMKEIVAKHPSKTGGDPKILEGEEIKFDGVDIFTPTGQLLTAGLNFTVKKNTNVLVSGRNGCGKSTIFRVLAGLFPLCSGTLTRPAGGKLFYVPQKPYMSPGTLRDQITYPLSLADGTLKADPALDAKLCELMDLVDLGYLVKREAWDTVKDWADVLSGGEKQRVAMARLFFHKPAFGILDECTSAVSVDVEAKIYETCKSLGITIFTVSHRPQLMHHHDYMLKLDGEGGWEWQALAH